MSDIPTGRLNLVAILVMTVETIRQEEQPHYKVGRVIHLWKGAYTFSYHKPDGHCVADWLNTLEHYPTREAAQQRMCDFVWNMNNLIDGRRM